MMFGQYLNIHRIFKRLTKALIRLHVCACCSEHLWSHIQHCWNIMSWLNYVLVDYKKIEYFICSLLSRGLLNVMFNSTFIFRFNVNLDCGADVAFHFDTRFLFGSDINTIVRNAKQNGSWGPEERQTPVSFPFCQDMFFDMIILTEHNCFKVLKQKETLSICFWCVYSYRLFTHKLICSGFSLLWSMHKLVLIILNLWNKLETKW